VGRLSAIAALRLCIGAFTGICALGAPAPAQPHNGGHEAGAPVYQRRAFEWWPGHGKRHDGKPNQPLYWRSPPVNAGWFQRPYPYHLDYYRMRYGGSYAPYFGNLYGPPQVVTAPPYYGPYYGSFGYPVDGVMGAPYESPTSAGPPANSDANSESLPPPQP
jgi:hypothetical protein